MKIVSWNVNSIRARQDRLLAWIDKHRPDAMCLQETKVTDPLFPSIELRALGYRAVTFGQKSYNGVAILATEDITDVSLGFTGDGAGDARLISARCFGMRLISVYVPNGQSIGSEKYVGKLEWLKRLRAYFEQTAKKDEPIVMCGDFNIAPDERDVYDPVLWAGSIHFSIPERNGLAEVVEWGLVDALRAKTDEGGKFTWWDYRRFSFQKDRGLRIDHFYVTPVLAPRIVSVTADREERKARGSSDHAPVILELSD